MLRALLLPPFALCPVLFCRCALPGGLPPSVCVACRRLPHLSLRIPLPSVPYSLAP